MPATNQQTVGQNEVVNPDFSKEQVILSVQHPQAVNVALTVTAGAYASGAVMGGIITFTNILRYAGGAGNAVNGLMTCKTAFAGPADLILFSKLPTGTYADNVALTLTAADALNVLGTLHLSDLTLAGSTITDLLQASASQSSFPVYNNETIPTQNLYGLLIPRAAITPGATTDVMIRLTINQH